MTARGASALLCAAAAVALLVAGFMPWFTAGDGGDDRRPARRDYTYSDVDELYSESGGFGQVRANLGLVSGETCVGLTCKPARYTGAPGLRDDIFAWLGRATLGAVLSGVALLCAVALAARTQRRPILRDWAATVVALAAGLGGAFVASQTLDGPLERGLGLGAMIVGAALTGMGAAWPWGRGEAAPARRLGLALAVTGLTTLAWITLAQHAWWRSDRSLDLLRVSPLGVEMCDGGDCRMAGALGHTATLRLFATVTALATAALLVPAFGAAARVARGIAPGAWAWTTTAVAWLGLGAGLATWASYPSSEVMTAAWGLPVFALAMGGAGAVALAAAVLVRAADQELAPGPVLATAPVGAVAPGARPVLVPLGGQVSAPLYAGPAPQPSPSPSLDPAPRPQPDPQLAPPPSPYAPPAPAPQPSPLRPALDPPTAAAAALGRRTAPLCPTCRVSTLWHGKRAAWWCSTCKQTL